MNVWRNYQRANLLMVASQAEVLQRELVQKSLHQLREYNHESHGAFVKPTLALQAFEKSWGKHVQGLSNEEVADLEQARAVIQHYEKIYNIFEYSTDLNIAMNILETRIAGNNVSVPMSVYRFSKSSSIESVFPEVEKCLEAYYTLMDDCEGYPDWQRKIEQDLGGVVSYLALTIDESSRDSAVEKSAAFKRFDSEKQKYFK